MPGDSARENGKKGGRPPGSKSKHTLEKEAAREFVRQRVTAELGPMVAAQIAKAKGLKFLITRDPKTGKFIPVTAKLLKTLDPKDIIEVWEKTPDTQAFNSLTDRALDKPKEQPQDIDADLDITLRWANDDSEEDE